MREGVDPRKEVRDFVYQRREAKQDIDIDKSVHEIVGSHDHPDGMDSDWWEAIAYVGVWSLLTAEWRRIKASEVDPRGPAQGDLFRDYGRVQEYYSLERGDRRTMVYVLNMSPEEFDNKIAEHEEQSAGHRLHADELTRLRDEIYPAH